MPFICEGKKIRNGIRMIWEHLWWMKNLNQVLRIISSCFPFSWIWKMLFMIFPQDVFVLLIKIFSLSWNCIEKKIIDLLRLAFSIDQFLMRTVFDAYFYVLFGPFFAIYCYNRLAITLNNTTYIHQIVSYINYWIRRCFYPIHKPHWRHRII